MKIRVHVFVRGWVQGVFFRSEMKSEARRHGVKGWVRNLSDGRVEAVFEGEEREVKALIDFCKRGPHGARVTDVQIIMENYSGEFGEFEIRHG